MQQYAELKTAMIRGWNTWNTRSVLSHVLLPEAFAINLGVRHHLDGLYLKESLFGRYGKDDEQVRPGPHATDGSYTEAVVEWRGIRMRVQTAVEEGDWVLLVTPETVHPAAPLLVLESGLLWNRPGSLKREGNSLVCETPSRTIRVFSGNAPVEEYNIQTQTPYLAIPLDRPVLASTGRARTGDEIRAIVARRLEALRQRTQRFGELGAVFEPVQASLAWDTIYEPQKDRVVSTVSRNWNLGGGGYMLFCWDTYFAAVMAGLDSRELAYSNLIEITGEAAPAGFVPNDSRGNGFKSIDRSQPPVGSMALKMLYRKFGDRWLIEYVFPGLLRWNRWWPQHRDTGGLLCWGSTPCEPTVPGHSNAFSNIQFASMIESGLDNTPMYDNVPFDTVRHQMYMADVGLTSMYVMDCECLADCAVIIGKTAEERELRERAEAYRKKLCTLWDDASGMFLNKRTDTGELSPRVSPTNFYALLARAATQEQAQRMMTEQFYNPKKFWGEWMMPSISRDDPAYADQMYWRGRIWAPMNFLVYLGMRNYALAQARRDLVEKSKALILKEWREKGHVHENYNADTGEGCDKSASSDALYHWGGLLGFIALMEAGFSPGLEP